MSYSFIDELADEAFTVYQETGMTPRQLVEKVNSIRAAHETLRKNWDESLTEAEAQRDELLASMKIIQALIQDRAHPTFADMVQLLNTASSAISKIEK